MQDVEQGEPQSQVLFRVTFLQCITLARQTLHHKSATYQQRHHEAARLPDLRRGGRLRGPPALPRGLPAGSAPESRPRPAPDDGGGTALEETSVMPAVAAVRGITPVEPLPSRRPAAAAASGITPDRPRPSSPSRAAARPPPRRAGSPPPGPIRPDGRGGGRARIHWSGTGRLCDVAEEAAGGRHDPTRGRISRAGRGAGVARDDLPESPFDMLQGARRGGIGRGDHRGRPGRCRERFRRPVPSFASITHLAWWDGVSHVVTRPVREIVT